MAASWLDSVYAHIAMLKTSQDLNDASLQSQTEQNATTTLTLQLQELTSLQPQHIAKLGKMLKEAELPSGWGKQLMEAAVRRTKETPSPRRALSS